MPSLTFVARIALLAALAWLGAWGGDAFANACQSNATGNWNAAATWTNCGGVISANACDQLAGGNCPNPAPGANYVKRELQAVLSKCKAPTAAVPRFACG